MLTSTVRLPSYSPPINNIHQTTQKSYKDSALQEELAPSSAASLNQQNQLFAAAIEMWGPRRALLAPAGWISGRCVDIRYYRVTKYKTRLLPRTGSPEGAREAASQRY